MPTKVNIPVRYKPVTLKLELPKDVVEELELYVDISKENDGDIGDEKTLRDRVVEGLLRQCFDRDSEFKKSKNKRKQELAETAQKELAEKEQQEALKINESARSLQEGSNPANDTHSATDASALLSQPISQPDKPGSKPDRTSSVTDGPLPSAEKDSDAAVDTSDDVAETSEKEGDYRLEEDAKGDRDSSVIDEIEEEGNGKHGVDPQATNPGVKEVEHLFDIS